LKDFIHVHKWSNKEQCYQYVGHLLYDNKYTDGAVSFHYDDDYLAKSGAELDPMNLSLSNKTKAYIEPSTKGIIPPYFQQFLPSSLGYSLFNKCLEGFDKLNQFQQLSVVSELYGDRGAIHLNGQNEQNNSMIESVDEMLSIIVAIEGANVDSLVLPSLEKMLPYNSASGNRLIFNIKEKHSSQSYFYKHSESTSFDEHQARLLTFKLETQCTIDSAAVKMVDMNGVQVSFQENYKFANHESGVKIRLNSVPFSALISNNPSAHGHLDYGVASQIIKSFSSEPEADLDELFRRALFCGHLNVTSNGLNNLELMDIGHNEWRLAPAFNNLPNPYHTSVFDLAFSDGLRAKKFFSIDKNFAEVLARQVSPEGISVVETFADITETVNSFKEIATENNIDIHTQDVFSKATATSHLAGKTQLSEHKNGHTLR
tara:strand:- start:7528 stop:8814 length:1287 start_codon:yes stop_codon:yes gene_type:complete